MSPLPLDTRLTRPDREDRTFDLHEGVRFVSERRKPVLLLALLIIVLAGTVVFYQRSRLRPSIEGTIALSFSGIERHEYPSGRKFDPMEFLAPDVLEAALRDTNLDGKVSVSRAAGAVSVAPVIPQAVVSRWKAADKEGKDRERYFPDQFHMIISLPECSGHEQLNFFLAIVQNYRGKAKRELYPTRFHLSASLTHENLATRFDYWDVPQAFGAAVPVLRVAIQTMMGAVSTGVEGVRGVSEEIARDIPEEERAVVRALGSTDPQKHASFVDLATELDLFERNDLAVLTSYTRQHRLVKQPEIQLGKAALLREQLTQVLQKKRDEMNTAIQMIARVDRPQFFVQDVGGTTKPFELTSDVISSLLKNDYYGDLIRKATTADNDAAALNVQLAELDRQIALLKTSRPVAEADLPPGYLPLLQDVARRYQQILQNYQRLLNQFVDLAVTNRVTVLHGPFVNVSERLPISTLAVLIVMLGLVGGVVLVYVYYFIDQSIHRTNVADAEARVAAGQPVERV